jgi:hypothetical protein
MHDHVPIHTTFHDDQSHEAYIAHNTICNHAPVSVTSPSLATMVQSSDPSLCKGCTTSIFLLLCLMFCTILAQTVVRGLLSVLILLALRF